MGIQDARMDENGYVYGTVPGDPSLPTVGLIAHMDTAPDASGADIQARIVEYTGGDILLNGEKGIYLRETDYASLKRNHGKHLIVTDGTTLLGADDKVYYYFGEPNYEDYTSLKETDYSPEGLRAMLLDRNKEVTARINDLKQQKKDEKITEEQFKEQAAEIKKDKNAPTVVIKGTDESSYKNLIDALDEMQICNISRYAIVDITDGDKFLLDNYEQKGELTRNIDR